MINNVNWPTKSIIARRFSCCKQYCKSPDYAYKLTCQFFFTFSAELSILSLYPRMTICAPKSFTYWRYNIRFYIVTCFIIIPSKFFKMAFPINLIYQTFKPKVFTNRTDNLLLHEYVTTVRYISYFYFIINKKSIGYI